MHRPPEPSAHETAGGVAPGVSQVFISGIPFWFEVAEGGRTMSGEATVTEPLRSLGSSLPRPSVLATISDCVAGIPAHSTTSPRLALTLDIAVRTVATHCSDRLLITGQIVKTGRSTVASEVDYHDEGGALVATSYVTFMASPRPQDHVPANLRGMRTEGSMPVAFPDFVGARILAPGTVEVERTPFVEQAAGSLQGGIVALIGELAAESLLAAPVTDLDVRYLSAVRVGPGHAVANDLGAGLVRVEVRDAGRDDRLTAIVIARVAPTR